VFALGLYSDTVVPAFSLSVSPAGDSASSCWLGWPAVPGKTYRAQFKQNLDEATWQDLNGQISIMGDRGYLKDAAPATSHRFYRILAY